MERKYIPYRPVHPGEILKDEIEYRGISQTNLAKQMGISVSLLNEVLHSKRPVNTKFAMLIEAVLGIKADTLLRMQLDYNVQTARKDTTLMSRIEKIQQSFAAAAML